MKRLWTSIDEKNWMAESKYRFTLLALGSLFGLIGLAAWLIVRIWAFSSLDWMACFIGYPIVISWILVFLYSCNHDYHMGKPQ